MSSLDLRSFKGDPEAPDDFSRWRKRLLVERFQRSQKLVWRRGKVADARPCCVVNGIHDRSAGTADPKLADALAAERAAMSVGFIEEHNVERADIRIHRDMIAGQILVDERAVARVDVILLDQR